MWTVCQVARWIPAGHERFHRRANSEMEQTHKSGGLTWGSAKHRMCVIKKKNNIKDLKQMKGGIQMSVSASTQSLSVGGWLRKDMRKIKHIQNTSGTFKITSLYLKTSTAAGLISIYFRYNWKKYYFPTFTHRWFIDPSINSCSLSFLTSCSCRA